MILTEQTMPQAMASYGQMQQGTAHATLAGTHNSQSQTYGTSQGPPAQQGSQAIPSPMSGVQHDTSMNPNAVRPTTFPPSPGYQFGYQGQLPNHGSAMAFSQPVIQHTNTGQFGYAPMPYVQHSGMNGSHGSYPVQHSSYTLHLGRQDYPVFVHNLGQQHYVHSGSTIQQHSRMGLSGPYTSQHANANPAFGAQAHAATPRSFTQIPNSVPVQNSVQAHNSVPMQNTLVDHSGSISYNRLYARRPLPPVTHHESNEAYSHTSHNLSVSNQLYTGQNSGIVYNEAYLAARVHSGQGQLRPRPLEGQREPQGSTTSMNSSTEILQQEHHDHEENEGPTEEIIQPHVESSTIDNRSATLPAKTHESISSGEQSSSLIEAPAQSQPRMGGPSSSPSNILEEHKLDAPPDVDQDVPEGSNSSSAQELGISETPDEISLEFSRFIDRLYPELIFPHDPPAAAFDEDNIKTWEMLSRI